MRAENEEKPSESVGIDTSIVILDWGIGGYTENNLYHKFWMEYDFSELNKRIIEHTFKIDPNLT